MSYSELDLVILKEIATNKQHALDFINSCSTNIFSSNLWNFANTLTGYVKTYKDVPTLDVLKERITKLNPAFLDTFNNIWEQLEKTKSNEKEYVINVEKLKARFANEEIERLKLKLSKNDDAQVSMTDMERAIRNIKTLTTTRTYERKTLKDSLTSFKEEINAKLIDPNFDSGVLTGYSFIDSATDGLRPGELLLIGGESGSGKSLLLNNMALQMWMQNNTIDQTANFNKGYNVIYFSLEMSFKACRNRIYSRLSGVPSKIIKRPVNKNGKVLLTTDHKNKLSKIAKFIKNYPYQFEVVDLPRGATAENIEMLMEEAVSEYRPDIIVVDYLGIMNDDSSKDSDDWLSLGVIAGKLHELVRVHDIIGLSAVQLNRTKSSGKDVEDKVGLHRIGRSSLIMHHANIGVQIETRQNEKNYPTMNCYIIKNRDGENMVKGALLKNLSCGTLLDSQPDPKEASEVVEFYDVDDISGDAELLDI